VKGDFFKPLGLPKTSNGERTCFISKLILHNWRNAEVEKIVTNVAAAMRAGDKYLIIEPVLQASSSCFCHKFQSPLPQAALKQGPVLAIPKP
jgi:hypothetical protein